MGTLLAFTMVAISVLILRYVPPDEVPLAPAYHGSIDSVPYPLPSSSYNIIDENLIDSISPAKERVPVLNKTVATVGFPLLETKIAQGNTCIYLDTKMQSFSHSHAITQTCFSRHHCSHIKQR